MQTIKSMFRIQYSPVIKLTVGVTSGKKNHAKNPRSLVHIWKTWWSRCSWRQRRCVTWHAHVLKWTVKPSISGLWWQCTNFTTWIYSTSKQNRKNMKAYHSPEPGHVGSDSTHGDCSRASRGTLWPWFQENEQNRCYQVSLSTLLPSFLISVNGGGLIYVGESPHCNSCYSANLQPLYEIKWAKGCQGAILLPHQTKTHPCNRTHSPNLVTIHLALKLIMPYRAYDALCIDCYWPKLTRSLRFTAWRRVESKM
jgi:hypothetical protein